MKLSLLPLLQIQRDLYALPRGFARFREYIKTMTDPETGDLALPLVAMNPMGKEHVPALIDQYIALDAETIAQEAIDVWKAGALAPASATAKAVAFQTQDYKVALVVSDDLKGGWTNRWASEFGHRIEGAAKPGPSVNRRKTMNFLYLVAIVVVIIAFAGFLGLRI